VLCFLAVHVRHERSEMRVLADEGWCLCRVDQGSSEFAGLVDAELLAQNMLVCGCLIKDGAKDLVGTYC
jgi:hypothetical protein